VSEVLQRQGYVSAVDVLVAMGKLTRAQVEDWRFARVPFLERVVLGNLSRTSLILREMARVCRELGLKPSSTAYRKWGRGAKHPLRFSKSGDPHLEQAYSTHWVSKSLTERQPPAAPGSDRGAGTAVTNPKDRQRRRQKPPRQVLQPAVPLMLDPGRVRQLAQEKNDENWKLRAFLKWSDLPERQIDRLFRRLSAQVSAEMDCTTCAACCRQMSPVFVTTDVERLARRLHLTTEEVHSKYLRETDDGPEFRSQPCPLLDGTRCSCYEDRPLDCRSYPHLHKRQMSSRLLAVIENATLCPIVYNVVELLKAELLARNQDWRGEAAT